MITSSQNPKLKLVRALQGRSKARKKEKAFIVEGVRLLEEAVNINWTIRFILYDRFLSKRGKKLLENSAKKGIIIEEVDSALLNALSDTENSPGILAVLNESQLTMPAISDFLLILDQIRDPGNLGTLLRTASAAGVDMVILAPKTADAFSPKVLRAGMGAHFRIPIIVADWQEIENLVRGLTVLLAEMAGDVIYTEASLKHACALIIGGEAEGASKSARALAKMRVRIPMSNKTESLNAAIAGAIIIFEMVRQRSK